MPKPAFDLHRRDVQLLHFLRERLSVRTDALPTSEFALDSRFDIRLNFHPNDLEGVYVDHLIVLTTRRTTGCCFCPHGGSSDVDGTERAYVPDVRELRNAHHCLEIAAIDAGYGMIGGSPDVTRTATGRPARKAVDRADLVVDEVERIAARSSGRSRVLVVGATGTMIYALVRRGFEVTATDLDPAVVGLTLAGVLIESGEHTLQRLQAADIAVVTGMTMATGTLGELLGVAQRTGRSLVMFLQSGANYASELLDLGVETAIVERFPFYMFPGTTEFGVFRRDHV